MRHQQLHHAPRRIELAGLLAGGVGELADQVFVGGAEEVGKLEVLVEQAVLVEVADETSKTLVGISNSPTFRAKLMCPSTPLKALWFSFSSPSRALLRFIGDVGVHVIQKSIPAGDSEERRRFWCRRTDDLRAEGFRF